MDERGDGDIKFQPFYYLYHCTCNMLGTST